MEMMTTSLQSYISRDGVDKTFLSQPLSSLPWCDFQMDGDDEEVR